MYDEPESKSSASNWLEVAGGVEVVDCCWVVQRIDDRLAAGDGVGSFGCVDVGVEKCSPTKLAFS